MQSKKLGKDMTYSDIRRLSLLGQRGTFGTTLKELAGRNDRILVLSADLTRTSGLEQFAREYPERLLNVGIAEENAVGMAAGLADQGFVPYVTTFTNFAALRANEFVRHFMAYMNCNVKVVGLSGGFAMELFGTTHYGLEDISVLRSMPNLTILSPADCLEVVKATEYAAEHQGPVYIRLSGRINHPIVHKADFSFTPGKILRLCDGEEVALYATGSMVHRAWKAGQLLNRNGVSCAVFDVHTIKPFDERTVREYRDHRMIVTVEEHCSVGGLGSAVAEVLSACGTHGRLIRFGTGDRYEAAGDYEYMLNKHGLTSNNIANTIMEQLNGGKL